MAHDGTILFTGAYFQAGEWRSDEPGARCQAGRSIEARPLPAREALSIRSIRPGRPDLLLEIVVCRQSPLLGLSGQPADRSILGLRMGISNTGAVPIRLKEFHPMAGAHFYPGVKLVDSKTLDGQSGARQNEVKDGPYRSSPNNLLLTFGHGKERRSLVLGGLTYHEFMKWASLGSDPGVASNRRHEIAARGESAGGKLAAYVDSGTETTSDGPGQLRLTQARGTPYVFDGNEFDPAFATIVFDNTEVIYQASGLDPAKPYVLGFSWWDYDNNGRVESVFAISSDGVRHCLLDHRKLPAWAGRREPPGQTAVLLPREAYADGKTQFAFTLATADRQGSNAVVSEVWLWDANSSAEPQTWAQHLSAALAGEAPKPGPAQDLYGDLKAADPLGRQVDPGKTWMGDDWFYVDAEARDPFTALELYGSWVKVMQTVRPNLYDFPTVCAWYAGVWRTPGAQNHPEKSKYQIATTPGLVGEADEMKKCGFLNYSRAAGRLVPDNYTSDNPQGWWDDLHWQQQGFYVQPYETSQKWGKAMQERGALAFTYFQPDRVSADFARAYPQLVVGGMLDYTHPDVRARLENSYAAMRGGISGMMFDYCDETWAHCSQGGFHNPAVTAASIYRSVFAAAREGLGPAAWIHERCLGAPNSDMAAGITDSQRTSGDTDRIDPAMVSRSGLRWYKNRVLFSYDMDSKEIFSSWKTAGFAGTDQDGRRMMLTMALVGASRLLLANSFRDMPPDVLHDLERTFPYPTVSGPSARPIDAFVAKGWPRVYDLPIRAGWHELTLFNTDGANPAEFAAPLSERPGDGGLALDPDRDYYLYDFWNDAFLGKIKGTETLRQTLRAGEARVISVHAVENHPQFLSTNRHILQGDLDMSQLPRWAARTLSGTSKVIGGETYRIVLACNGYHPSAAHATGARARLEQVKGQPNLRVLVLDASENTDASWTVKFDM